MPTVDIIDFGMRRVRKVERIFLCVLGESAERKLKAIGDWRISRLFVYICPFFLLQASCRNRSLERLTA